MSSEPHVPQSLQDLLPKWAHFCLYTERFITHELGLDLKGKHVVVGFSGGVDSTALLMVMHYLSVRNDVQLTAAHLNHGLRPEASQDASWTSLLCDTLAIPFELREVDVRSRAEAAGIGIEEAGRHARYDFLEAIRIDKGADYIAVGHHLDDLGEDVIMRFIRGTGWPGLAGMPAFAPERHLVRPFLMLPKSTLRAFVSSLGIQWREDASNDESEVTRNRIRNELIPLILRENPSFHDSVGRLWKIGRVETDYWDELAGCDSDVLSNVFLERSHQAVRLRLYKSCLDSLGPGQALAHTLFKLDEAWSENRIGATFQFPGGKTASITASGVVFSFKH